MGSAIDLTGQTFGRLTALRRVGKDRKGSARWLCECTVSLGGCGTEYVTTCDSLRHRHAFSCGCLRRSVLGVSATKHGQTAGYKKTREYETWRSMRARCHRPSNRAWANYGGRGITVCDRWRHDFAAFLADMGPKPSPLHSIDRIDNDGNYEPGNCRWATDTEQGRNTRTNSIVEFNGRSLCMSEWSEVLGIPYNALRKRFVRGWPTAKAFGTPLRASSTPLSATGAPTTWPVGGDR